MRRNSGHTDEIDECDIFDATTADVRTSPTFDAGAVLGIGHADVSV
jgi:hypothetical protein